MTNAEDHNLRIEMTDADGNFRRADYGKFRLTDATKFNLEVSEFESDNRWGLRDDLNRLNGRPFTAPDQNHGDATDDCASSRETAGWLLAPSDGCIAVNPFSQHNLNSRTAEAAKGIFFPSFEGETNSLQTLVFLIKPKS